MELKRFGTIPRALISIVLCICVALLSFWATNTETAGTNFALTAGGIQASAKIVGFGTFSNGIRQGEFENYSSDFGGKFGEYGSATIRSNILSLNRLKVGDRVDFSVGFTQKSASKTQYRFVLECINDKYLLYGGLKVTVRSSYIPSTEFTCTYDGENPMAVISDWVSFPDGVTEDTVRVSISLPASSAEYAGCGTQVSVCIQVVKKA